MRQHNFLASRASTKHRCRQVDLSIYLSIYLSHTMLISVSTLYIYIYIYIYMCVCVCVCVSVCVCNFLFLLFYIQRRSWCNVYCRRGDASSNPKRSCLYFVNTLENGMHPTILSPAMDRQWAESALQPWYGNQSRRMTTLN